MLKPTFLNICISIILKYLIFYILLMIINDEFKLLQVNNIKNGQDLFYYLWIVLFFPIVDMILFATPLYYSLRAKSLFSVLGIVTILVIEYFIYAYFTSQKVFNQDAFLKMIISMIVLIIFFHKTIKSKFIDIRN
jgi:ABC-type Na+ efflux pump permease subunit